MNRVLSGPLGDVVVDVVAVIGSGMAGLATALAMTDSGRQVVLIERDPAPPQIDPAQAFECWERPGVPQFRHAHILLSRLQTTLRDRYPALLDELLAAGLELSTLTEVLPETQVADYAPRPGDQDLLHLWGRRPTFEYVVRRYVERLRHVRFIHDAKVTGLLTEARDGQVLVRGLNYEHAGRQETLAASLVVDASGKRSRCPDWLAEQGVRIERERHPSDRVYVCRHYQLNDPTAERPRTGTGANLDYFGFVIFYGERGHFAITLSCPVEETDFARAMSRPEGFERICREVPLLSAWQDKARPTTKVLGASQFENGWRRFGAIPGPALHGFVAVGDAHVETNPMYGRGCTSAFIQAHLLRDALDADGDAAQRASAYQDSCRAVLQPHFDFCVSTDNLFRSRGRDSRGEPIPRIERVLQWAFERLWTPALEQSAVCAREMVRAMEMRDISPLGTRMRMVAHVFLYGFLSLLTGRRARSRIEAPTRSEALRMLEDRDTG